MPYAADPARAIGWSPWQRTAVVAALILAGFAWTIWVFYPGVMNYDARYVHEYAMKGQYGDWQSPLMAVLWRLIDPIAPGAGSMFLLIALVYWAAFAILALRMARQSLGRAVVMALLALTPPAFLFVGMIWRDVLLAGLWLMAAALAWSTTDSPRKLRIPVQGMAIVLLALGVLLRPNGLFAAPILATFLLWPSAFSWKRAAILLLPGAIASYALVQVVYYGVLHADRQNPLQSLMVFDLGGITHFSGQNQFPTSWTPQQEAMLTARCYRPNEWNVYWLQEPCDFVMTELESRKVFGSPAMVDAWRRAIIEHPLAYLRHRAGFTWNFLARANMTIWTQVLDDTQKTVFADRPRFMAVKAVDDALAATPLSRAGTWLLLCVGIGIAGWRRRDTPAGAFALGVCGSAVAYVLTLSVLGVASDFRYAYWAVLAALAGAMVIWPASPATP